MFQDTLLIIKCDYLSKRKALLLHILQLGFFIKGQRKINFSPELAADFYQNIGDDRSFMFQVILLSKGNSEAFILCKENSVDELLSAMLFYFGTSLEMERNVHVTECQSRVQREISFIFPNYICDHIYCREQLDFCLNDTLVEPTITKLYDIITKPEIEPHKSWREKLAEFLISSNKKLPHISNHCSYNSNLELKDISQQTKITSIKHEKSDRELQRSSEISFRDLTNDSTFNITSSSCISCSQFGGSRTECIQPNGDKIKARTASLEVKNFLSRETSLAMNVLNKWTVEEHIDTDNIIPPKENPVIRNDEVDEFGVTKCADILMHSPFNSDLNLEVKCIDTEYVLEVIPTFVPNVEPEEEIELNIEHELPFATETSVISTENIKICDENMSISLEKNILPKFNNE